MVKVMESAKIKSRIPLNFANSSVLNPMIRKMAKIISAAVAIVPTVGIKVSGTHGFNTFVYSKKLSQFPQAELSLGHMPNRSAEADRNPKAMASLKKSLIIFMIFNFIPTIGF